MAHKEPRKRARRSRGPRQPIPSDPHALLTSAEVQYLLGDCSRTTLYRMVRSGAYPQPDRKIGERRLWRRATHEEWLTTPRTNADVEVITR